MNFGLIPYRFIFAEKKAGNAVPNGNANHLEDETASVEPTPPVEKATKGKGMELLQKI